MLSIFLLPKTNKSPNNYTIVTLIINQGIIFNHWILLKYIFHQSLL